MGSMYGLVENTELENIFKINRKQQNYLQNYTKKKHSYSNIISIEYYAMHTMLIDSYNFWNGGCCHYIIICTVEPPLSGQSGFRKCP